MPSREVWMLLAAEFGQGCVWLCAREALKHRFELQSIVW